MLTITELQALVKHLSPVIEDHASRRAAEAEARVRAEMAERIRRLERRVLDLEEYNTRPESTP